VEQPLHQVAIVGEEQHALGVEVEAPDREDALGLVRGSSSLTVGRPSGSSSVVTTPRGLNMSR